MGWEWEGRRENTFTVNTKTEEGSRRKTQTHVDTSRNERRMSPYSAGKGFYTHAGRPESVSFSGTKFTLQTSDFVPILPLIMYSRPEKEEIGV